MPIPLEKHSPGHNHQKSGKLPEIILHEKKEIQISMHSLTFRNLVFKDVSVLHGDFQL